MEDIQILKVFGALAAVVVLLMLFSLFLQRVQKRGVLPQRRGNFKIDDILYLDQKRKIVSIICGEKTYILLLGNAESVIDIIESDKMDRDL